jgi:CheY-like chemotaxis protein
MNWSRINLCYYPTTVVLVDDQKSFLNEFKHRLDKSLAYQLYDNPKKLLEDFSRYHPDYFINRSTIIPDEDNRLDDRIVYDVDLRQIHKEIYNPKRFEQVSVLIADYAMPGINGLECCKNIQNKYIKKILLTGEADNDLAVKAFNEGVINKFIPKNTPDLARLINQSIFELQMQYFSDLSESLFYSALAHGKIPNYLNDKDFMTLFNQKCEEFKIVEYYLLDSQGSFLMLDEDANPYWLIVKSEQEMENLYQFAALEQAPVAVVDALKHREKIPYFYTDKDLESPPAHWVNYMHPADKLEGKKIYYSFHLGNKTYPIEINKIISYQSYLKKVRV